MLIPLRLVRVQGAVYSWESIDHEPRVMAAVAEEKPERCLRQVLAGELQTPRVGTRARFEKHTY